MRFCWFRGKLTLAGRELLPGDFAQERLAEVGGGSHALGVARGVVAAGQGVLDVGVADDDGDVVPAHLDGGMLQGQAVQEQQAVLDAEHGRELV